MPEGCLSGTSRLPDIAPPPHGEPQPDVMTVVAGMNWQ